MDYNGGAAVSAGLIGGAVMAGVLYTGMAIAPRQIQMDLFHTLGTMLTPRGGVAVVYMAGAVAHALFSLIIGLVYALLFLPFADGTNVVGWGGSIRVRSLGYHWRGSGAARSGPSIDAFPRAAKTRRLRHELPTHDRRWIPRPPSDLWPDRGWYLHRIYFRSHTHGSIGKARGSSPPAQSR